MRHPVDDVIDPELVAEGVIATVGI